ncbi:antibiotic biosynthesis monooxygenase [Streptomyces sp. JJ66]|uniref:antibiotic biosynthesis monooxygenase n=1 Tax=Streptomyces sp. JJ66 TaxID=2803843 RepID=UPI001C55E395|nr:antibiotic biosynthesis monooxygenase [Streptomyces sp. JJ66]MBW1602494.1 antibiotic biosynthesis monooxygenase [Streptomyces sp. JJ66]
MEKTGRDLARSLTVVNRFTVNGDIDVFEREFRAHCEFLRARRGFDFLVAGQLVDTPNVFVHFSHWVTHQAFLRAVHSDGYLSEVHRLAPLVDAEADQAVSLGRLLEREARTGAQAVVILHGLLRSGNQRDFEWRYHELAGHCAAYEGFGGGDVLRSTLTPNRYLAVLWWQDSEVCDAALGEEGYRKRVRELGAGAQVRTERLRHVAYSPALSR